MTALSEFAAFCVRVFVELVQLSIDLLVLPFFLGALLMPWRGPVLLFGLCAQPKGFWRMDSRASYRGVSLLHFLLGLFEGVTLAILPIVALSGFRH